MKDLILFDLDGTLANIEHRLPYIQTEPKDWKSFFEACDKDVMDVSVGWLYSAVRWMADQEHKEIWVVSGRSDSVRIQTEAWLRRHGLPYSRLLMRSFTDHRPDEVLKAEWAVKHNFKERVLFVVDDRSRVVKMWRSLGIPCFQVAEGEF